MEKKIIWQDSSRTFTVDHRGCLKIESAKLKEPRHCHLSAANIKAHPAGVSEHLQKIKETPADWYTLFNGSQPVATLPNASRQAVEAAIESYKADEAERKIIEAADLLTRDEAARAECPADHVLARQNWSNGDLCAAEYQTEDGLKVIASDLLESHHGWYYLPSSQVEAERTKQQAATDREAAAKASTEADRAAKFAQAKATDKPVVLRTWMTDDCTTRLQDCSFDSAAEIAMPDGTTHIEYTHCF